MYAIRNGLSAYGDPNSPTYYQAAPSTLPLSYNNWHSKTSIPGSATQAPAAHLPTRKGTA